MTNRLTVIVVVLSVLSLISGPAFAETQTSWIRMLSSDSEGLKAIDLGGNGSVSPLGVRVTGVDLGGCADVSSIMFDVVTKEIERGIVGSGFEIQTADVHCRAQGDGTYFSLVILGSGFPWKHLSYRSYETFSPLIGSADVPLMESNDVVWGRHAVQFLTEEGKVARIAFFDEDREGQVSLNFWNTRDISLAHFDVRKFRILRRGEHVFALTLSERRCRRSEECPEGARMIAIMKHSEGDEIVDFRILSDVKSVAGNAEIDESLVEEFERLAGSSEPAFIEWVR